MAVRVNRGDILWIEPQKFLDGIQYHGIDEVVVFMNESIPQAGGWSEGDGKVRRKDPSFGQEQKAAKVIVGRGLAALYEQVRVQIDRSFDRFLQQPFCSLA